MTPGVNESTLGGVSVVVTRASHQSEALAAALTWRGATVIEAPAISIVPPLDGGQPLDDALLRLERFTWVAFTSANALSATLARAARRGVRRKFEHLRVAAVGRSTADRVEEELGRPADLVPDRHDAASLAAAFPSPKPHDRVFVPMATGGRTDLVEGLEAKGWDVWSVAAYRTVHPTLSDHLIARVKTADVITFASPSAVRGHLQQLSGHVQARVVCIGHTTAAECSKLGVEVASVASEQSIQGLVAAVEEVAP